ncbi:MAG: tRNA (adenosine(37)-N6)-threonylcarbamoyltransferase complex dimerization subunit type 1 TsaB [Bacteroidales bacterium]
MENFILIETSTKECSVGLMNESGLLSFRKDNAFKVHAKKVIPFIQEVLEENNLSLKDCSAISVSKGPGSYTGLRVGVSSAKGLCFGADIPLIGIGTLEILAHQAKEKYLLDKENDSDTIILPMIDARRMEVYSSRFDYNCNKLNDTQAIVLDEHSFDFEFNNYKKIIFIGDGAEKYKECLTKERLEKSIFDNSYPNITGMVQPTLKAFKAKKFEDTAYFEPFYLKEFIAGISKKKLF